MQWIGIWPILAILVCWIRVSRSSRKSDYAAFRALLAFFVASFIFANLLDWAFTRKSSVYHYYFFLTDALHWALWLAALSESALLVLRNYEGLASFGRAILRAGVAFSGLSLAVVAALSAQNPEEDFISFWRMETYAVYGSLALLAVVFAALAAYFRVVPDRNTILIYTVLAAVLIGTKVDNVAG